MAYDVSLSTTRPTAPLPPIALSSDMIEILSLIGDGVVSIDHEGRIILLNRAAEELFGYSSQELLGSPIEVLLPARFGESHRKDVREFVLPETSARRSMADGREVLGQHKNGREFAVEATLSRHMFAGKQTFTAVIRDVTDRKSAEQKRSLIADEVAHRLRNTMAVVNSLVSLTARGATSLPSFLSALEGRFAAISRTNDTLISGTRDDASLRRLLVSELAAFQNDDDRIKLVGPDIFIKSEAALSLALIFHELATNAVKYGALSVANGTIEIGWRNSPDKSALEIVWQEAGGPPVSEPARQGFGSRLILSILRAHGGTTQVTYPTEGVCCTIAIPVPAPPTDQGF